MPDDDFHYPNGPPNPKRPGFIPLRHSSGEGPDMDEIGKAAGIVGRPSKSVDANGYEQEIIAAAVEGGEGSIAYVQCRAKNRWTGFVDINFHIHLREPDGAEQAWPIETYNPFFGCDVGFFQWIDQSAVLIYREKHRSYVCKITPGTSPLFAEIADDWVIHGRILGYWDWQETEVSRLSLPDLRPLDAISEEEAKAAALLPSKYW